jgi:predicted nucleic acid-binding protein
MPRFLDTNILLRYYTNDDPAKARRALALLRRVEQGKEQVATSLLVVSETVFTLERFYKMPKLRVYEIVADVISMRNVQLPGKSLCLDALELHATENVSFVDAYNSVDMQARGINEIYSWDTDFDRLPGVVRIEPHESDL